MFFTLREWLNMGGPKPCFDVPEYEIRFWFVLVDLHNGRMVVSFRKMGEPKEEAAQ